jgi:hypothetical protein
MMLDWNAYRAQLTQRIGELGRLSPDTVRGYRGLSRPVTKPVCSAAKPVN